MADIMTFPETVEEFMEQYKITDTEQIYTNGTELVPIFRMKQWFDHKKGKWRVREIHSVYGDGFELTCSECGNLFTVTKDAFPFEHFCRNCGADMR